LQEQPLGLRGYERTLIGSLFGSDKKVRLSEVKQRWTAHIETLRDVIAQLGADFWRLRIGVGHPGSKDQVIDAVLDRATADEQGLIDAALVRAHAALPELLRDGAQKAMHRLHTQDETGSAAGK
jgi:peptidyl-tRNA hydrolase